MNSYVCITGATGGLGKAFANECAFRGWDLILTDISEDNLQSLAQGINRQYNVRVMSIPCDLSDHDDFKTFWEYINKNHINLHMMINVAGIEFEGPFSERSIEELRTIIRLNIEGTVVMTSCALQYRDPTRILRVINVGSLAGYYPMPVKAVYAASKRFLLDFTIALRQEYSPNEVTFTALCPAGMPTTPRSIKGILAQGLIGKITTLNVGDVAARTIDMSLAGRNEYIPGVWNNVIRTLGSIFPPSLAAKLIRNRWKKAHKNQDLKTVNVPNKVQQ